MWPYFLLIYNLQPSGAPGPPEALLDSSQGQQVEEGLRTAATRQLPGWLDWQYQPPATAHPSPCQPLLEGSSRPYRLGWGGRQLSGPWQLHFPGL